MRPSPSPMPWLRLAALGAALSCTTAHAATQGTLGATSTGTSTISVTKSVQAQISDIINQHLYDSGLLALGEFLSRVSTMEDMKMKNAILQLLGHSMMALPNTALTVRREE